jgi:hypothetical protein
MRPFGPPDSERAKSKIHKSEDQDTEINNPGKVREEVCVPGILPKNSRNYPDFFPTEKKVPFSSLHPEIIPKLPHLLP